MWKDALQTFEGKSRLFSFLTQWYHVTSKNAEKKFAKQSSLTQGCEESTPKQMPKF